MVVICEEAGPDQTRMTDLSHPNRPEQGLGVYHLLPSPLH